MKLSDQDKIDIVNEYKSGISGLQLSRKYKVSCSSIFSILRKRNIDIRGNSIVSRKYTINENYFKKIDSEDKAYFLGLLYADGYNNEKVGSVTLTLQFNDKHILELFNKKINHSKPLYFIERNKKNKNWKNVYKLEICNKTFSRHLANLGCVQKKALILRFPTEDQVPKHLINHFIRGYLDGDGHIGERSVQIVSSCYFIDSLSSKLNLLGIKTRVIMAKNGNNITKRLNTSTQYDSIKFLDWIYKNSKFKFKRKYGKYLLFKKNYSYHPIV